MKLSKILSMRAIAKRVGGIVRATLYGIQKDYYTTDLLEEKTSEIISGAKENYFSGGYKKPNFYRNKF